MSRWFRFYDDAVNDPKLLRLPDDLYRAWTILLCFASKNGGTLPPADDIALALRLKPAKVCEWLTKLVRGGLIDQNGNEFAPHNWNGRQYKSDVSTERVKRFRNGKRNVSETASETAPETETETETEQTLPTVAKTARAKKRAVPLPADWVPSARAYEIAEQFGQNVQIVEGIFRDYVASSGKLYADHDAAFHNFIRNQNSFNRGSSNGTAKNQSHGGSLIAAIDRKLAAIEAEERADFALPENAVRRISG